MNYDICLVSKKDAIARGRKTYFTGKLCRKCGTHSRKFVVNDECQGCYSKRQYADKVAAQKAKRQAIKVAKL